MDENPLFQKVIDAACLGDAQAVQDILRQGFDINEADKVGNTVLMWTALNSAQGIRLLIAHNPDLNHQNEDGWSALMWTASHAKIEAAKVLIDHGADINAKRGDGYSVLMVAVERRSMDIISLLLEKGVDIDARNDNDVSAADIAERIGDTALVQMLNGAKENIRRRAEEAALQEENAKRMEIEKKVNRLKENRVKAKVRLKPAGP